MHVPSSGTGACGWQSSNNLIITGVRKFAAVITRDAAVKNPRRRVLLNPNVSSSYNGFTGYEVHIIASIIILSANVSKNEMSFREVYVS